MRIHTAEDKQKMLLTELAVEYESFQETNRLLSANTRSNYVSRVRRFAEAHPKAVVADLNRALLTKFLHNLAETHPASPGTYRAAIRHFCLWMKSVGWPMRTLPTDGIKLVKRPKSRRDPVPDDALEKLLDACDRLPRSEYRRILAKAALSTLVYGGMRRAELIDLRVEDVELSTRRVWIRCGKGNESRVLYLCQEGIVAIREMLALRKEEWTAARNFLFIAPTGKPLRVEGLMSLLRDLHEIAKLPRFYTPHQLRHAYASRLARNGVPLPVIQALLGHVHLVTTTIYVHTNEEDLKAASEMASLKFAKPTTPLPETPKTAPAPTSAKQEGQKRFRVRRLR